MFRIQATLLTVVGVGIALTLGGCIEAELAKTAYRQQSSPKYTPDTAVPTDRAAVYVYRPEFVGFAVSPTVTANGVSLADLPVHQYFVYHAAPGALKLSSKSQSVSLDISAGETYNVKASLAGTWTPSFQLVLMPKDVGEREIQACCKQASDSVPTAETVAAGPPPAKK